MNRGEKGGKRVNRGEKGNFPVLRLFVHINPFLPFAVGVL